MRISPFADFLRKLYSPEGDPSGGGGTGTAVLPDPATAPPAPGAPAPGAAGAGTGQPAGAVDPNTGRFVYAEDRSRWIPPHRYNEVAERTRRLEAAYEQQQARVRALMGIDAPPDPRRTEILNALKELNPSLARILDADPKALERMLSGQPAGEQSDFEKSYWRRLAIETTNDAVTEYAKAIGTTADKLPANRLAFMARQINAYIESDDTGERRARYEARDPTFISEFIAELRGFYVAPGQGQAARGAAGRTDRAQRLPSTRGPQGIPPGGGAGGPAKPKTRKEIHEAARQALLDGTAE